MSIKHKVVMFNGGVGVGKSWASDRLMEELTGFQSYSSRTGKRLGFRTGIDRATLAMLGKDSMTPLEWAEFKVSILPNMMTGRQFMIHLATLGRAMSPTHWTDIFIKEVRRMDSINLKGFIFVVDSFGFPDEFERLRVQEDFDLLTVYIDDDHYRVTEGEFRQFDNDSRFDLSRYCTIRAENSTVALRCVLKSLVNRGW